MKKIFVRLGCLVFFAFAASTAMAARASSDVGPTASTGSATSVVVDDDSDAEEQEARCQIGSGAAANTCEPLAGGWYCDKFTKDGCRTAGGRWLASSGHCYFANKPANCN
jgi:hypothetical protein